MAAFGVEGARAALLAQTHAEVAWLHASRAARIRHAMEALLSVRRCLAHDVRSPLGVVLGHGQMLEEGLVDGDEVRASGRTLARQAQRLTQMTEEAAHVLTCAASPVPGVDGVDLTDPWNQLTSWVQGKARGWVRPGALAEVVERIRESLPPSAAVRVAFSVAVRPSRVVCTLVADAPFDEGTLGSARRALASLRGTLLSSGATTLRVELPGDDGRLAVKLVGEDASVAVGLRAAGLRVTDPDACADVALVLPGAKPVADGVRRLYVGAGSPAPCVPHGVPIDTLVRVLRRVAEAPRAICPIVGASCVPTPGAQAELRFVARSPLVKEEAMAFVAERLEEDAVGESAFVVPDGLRVGGASLATLASWFESGVERRLREAFPACSVRILAL